MYIVRFGTMRRLGAMSVRHDAEYRRGMEVIVRSDRGLEVGQVLCAASDDSLSHLDNPPSGQIVRAVSDDDLNEINHIDGTRKSKLEICERHIKTLKLDMKLIDVEQLFGGERLVVYYLAEERVDFRELVKLLASEFQTRIEMRQIGVRDEAKLLADYGDCGKPVCCNNHLVAMPPVSMKMAKLQKATLDPTKISGRCGRLKCCLRYEFDTYEEIRKSLPRVGAQIVTRNGKAKVLNQKIIAEQLLVETEDHRRMVIDASEVLSVIKSAPGGKRNTATHTSDSQATESDSKNHGKSQKRRSGSRQKDELSAEKEATPPDDLKDTSEQRESNDPNSPNDSGAKNKDTDDNSGNRRGRSKRRRK